MLWLAAVLLIFIGVAHSYLTEKVVMPRLLALPDLPPGRDRGFAARLHRNLWHLVTLYLWAAAALLIVLAVKPANEPRALGLTLAATFLASAGVCLAVGWRHPAWLPFLAAAALTVYGVW